LLKNYKMVIAIVYVLGFLASYILIKILRQQVLEDNWGFVILGAILSLGSWVTFLLVLLVIGVIYLLGHLDIKPPKWL
jgi:hypothetical protein